MFGWPLAPWSGADRDCFVSISIRAVFLWIPSAVFLFHQFVIYFSGNVIVLLLVIANKKADGESTFSSIRV